jgi:hypothetical protein
VMGPPPHPDVERLINIRAADAGFVLDQLSRLAQLDPGSPLAGHLDLQHVGIIGHSIGGATAVQVMRTDPRCKVAVNLDGKLFGSQSAAHLNGPLLWIQSGGPQTTEYTQGRDRLLSRLRDGGALVTVLGSVHMGFTDAPAYLRPIGRSVIGPLSGIGSISLADMTSMTGDAISAFIGPALAVNNTPRIPASPDRSYGPTVRSPESPMTSSRVGTLAWLSGRAASSVDVNASGCSAMRPVFRCGSSQRRPKLCWAARTRGLSASTRTACAFRTR